MANESNSGGVFLSESFVKNILPGLRSDFLKIYIYLKHTSSFSDADAKTTAAVLGFDEQTVKSAISFFTELGLENNSNTQNKSYSPIKTEPPVSDTDFVPHYNSEEVFDVIAASDDLQLLLVTAQKVLGKLPSASSTIILYELYDWLKMPSDLILRLLQYCVELGKKDMRYIEKVAISWHKMGITTCEAADEYILRQSQKSKFANGIKKILGITQRNYTPTEQRYIDSWYELGFSLDLISYAFDYTVTKTGKLTFPYMNTVLLAWNEKGIHTADDAMHSVESFQIEKAAKRAHAAKAKSAAPKTKQYEIYNSGRYDYDQIERAARKKITDSLKNS